MNVQYTKKARRADKKFLFHALFKQLKNTADVNVTVLSAEPTQQVLNEFGSFLRQSIDVGPSFILATNCRLRIQSVVAVGPSNY